MKNDKTLLEAKRLWDEGFAIIWLYAREKRPKGTGWTTGSRKSWEELKRTYKPKDNIGVRLGTPSQIGNYFLACVDLDIKDPSKRKELVALYKEVLKGKKVPEVRSGGGNGNRHGYILTPKPFKMITVFKEKDVGEICIYSDGRQMALPPSIHPSGREYVWKVPVNGLIPLFQDITVQKKLTPIESEKVSFALANIEIDWLPLSQETCDKIKTCEGVADRSAYLMRATTALYSAGLSRDEVLSVLTDRRYKLADTAFEHAKTNNRQRAAAWLYQFTTRHIEKERSPQVFKGLPSVKPKSLTAAEIEKQTEAIEAERPWQQDLILSEKGIPKQLLQNVFLILSKSVALDVVRRDDFCYRDAYTCNTPWGGKKDDIVKDGDVDECQLWFGKNFQFEPPKSLIESSFLITARQNAFDPVKDFLKALPKWDRIPRLDTWLFKNFEAKGCPEYLAQVFRKWMVAMVMRVYRPGAKFDWMPIFEGVQGIGKSSFGRLLVGDKYFLDWLPNLHDKDSALALQGMWGVEMGELSQFRRNELETIKAFITRTVDKVRPPFGKRLIESARRCVFFGTTNRNTYLIDETGNRRFKPIEVGNLNFKALRQDRLQLFAEAKWLWKNKKETEESLELTGIAKDFERQIHQEKMVEDDSHSMEESMRDFVEKVDKKEVVFDLQKFKILDLFETVGPLGNWKKETRNLMFASKMIKRLGGQSRFIMGRKYWKLTKVGPMRGAPPTIQKGAFIDDNYY